LLANLIKQMLAIMKEQRGRQGGGGREREPVLTVDLLATLKGNSRLRAET